MKNESINKPIRVIHMAPLGSGGISKLTVEINSHLDPETVIFDYLVFRDEKEFLEDEALSYGGKKQVVDLKPYKNAFIRFYKKHHLLVKLFKREKYDVVHVDASTPYDSLVALAAKLSGIRVIILHSHNDSFHKRRTLRDVFMPLYKGIMKFACTDYLAISEPAAQFMFPKAIIAMQDYLLVKNGIDADSCEFNLNERDRIREELRIADKYVIGHVGRFVYQKNHDFILRVFAQIKMQHANVALLLVGEGELYEKMKELAKELKIEDSVRFYGVTHEIGALLSAMDSFIFPSHFEGLGIAAIEAQANGLQVFAADSIVEEADISCGFYRIHGWDAKHWAEEIWENRNRVEHKGRKDDVIKAGYDILDISRFMQNYYVQKVVERSGGIK